MERQTDANVSETALLVPGPNSYIAQTVLATAFSHSSEVRPGHKLIICAICDLYEWFVAGCAAEGDADAEVAFGVDGVG